MALGFELEFRPPPLLLKDPLLLLAARSLPVLALSPLVLWCFGVRVSNASSAPLLSPAPPLPPPSPAPPLLLSAVVLLAEPDLKGRGGSGGGGFVSVTAAAGRGALTGSDT